MGGLTVFVSLRAPQWLGKFCTIISPVMQLEEALEVYARLLRARRQSWEALRAEWVDLMQLERYIRAKTRTLGEARAIADEAREQFLVNQRRRAKECELREQARASL